MSVTERVKLVPFGGMIAPPATRPDPTPVDPRPVTPIPAEPVPARPAPEPIRVESAPLTPTPLETIPLPERPRDRLKGDYTKIPNGLIGGDLAALSTGAQVLYLHLVQLTLGHNRQTCQIGHKRITERTGLSKTAIRRAVAQLEAFGLVDEVGVDATCANVRERGTEYRVYLPRRTRLESTPVEPRRVEATPMKETPRKKDHETTPDKYQIREQAARLHHAYPDDTHSERVDRVVSAFAAQGREATSADVEAALEGLAL